MIEVRDLVHRYGGTTALDGVSLTVADGECVALAGPNGAGKTTLVRHCNALLAPDEGAVLVDGVPATADPVAARTAVGMVFQTPRDGFVAATVGADVAFGPENLGLPREAVDARVERALAAVGMADRREARVARLSGGERQRVAIAGALAMEPAHLVLDEPFAGLDDPGRRGVLARLAGLRAAGTSLVVVTHDLRDVLGLVDRVVVLADGRVALDATPDVAHERVAEFGVRPPAADRTPAVGDGTGESTAGYDRNGGGRRDGTDTGDGRVEPDAGDGGGETGTGDGRVEPDADDRRETEAADGRDGTDPGDGD